MRIRLMEMRSMIRKRILLRRRTSILRQVHVVTRIELPWCYAVMKTVSGGSYGQIMMGGLPMRYRGGIWIRWRNT